MACPYCKEKKESFKRSITATEENDFYTFPIDDILTPVIEVFPDLYKCNDCKTLWMIHTRGTGDPRSTFPEYYEQSAVKIASEIAKIIYEPTLNGILKLTKENLPYNFFSSVLQFISEKEKENLKELYLKQDPDLPSDAKNWLEKWFLSEFSEEYDKFKQSGFNEGALVHSVIEKNTNVLSSEFISLEEFVLFLEHEDNSQFELRCLNLKHTKVIWSNVVKSPFREGLQIPFLFYQSGYLCSFHGYQSGSEYYNKLHRPNLLVIHSLNGDKLLEIPLALKSYEVLSTEERDYSECRLVHNFSFTILNDLLFLPHKSNIHIYSLVEKKKIKEIALPDGQVFSGKLYQTEDEQFLILSLKGCLVYDSNWNLVSNYKSNYHPVAIDLHLNVFYYYAKVDNLLSGQNKVFTYDTSSGISLVRELNTPPISLPNGNIMIPFSMDGSELVNSELKPIKSFPFTCTDVLGPHSISIEKIPYLVVESAFCIYDDYKNFHILDFDGNIIYQSELKSSVSHLLTFDGKHIVLIIDSSNGYGYEDNYELLMLGPEGKCLTRKLLRSIKGLSISFNGILLYEYNKQILMIDLFVNVS